MDLRLLCQGFIVIISVCSVSSTSDHGRFNKHLLEDIRNLNKSSNNGRFQTPRHLSSSNYRENKPKSSARLNEAEQEEEIKKREQNNKIVTHHKTTIRTTDSVTAKPKTSVQKTTEMSTTNRAQDNKTDATLHKTIIRINRSVTTRPKTYLLKTTERFAATSDTLTNDKNEHIHRPLYENTAKINKTGTTVSINVNESRVTEETYKLTKLMKMLDSKQQIVTTFDRQHELSTNKIDGTTIPGNERNSVATYTAGNPKTQTEQSKPQLRQKTTEFKTTLLFQVTGGYQIRNEQEKVSAHTLANRYTTSATTLKKKTANRLSFKSTKDLERTKKVASKPNVHAAMMITNMSRQTTSQRPIVNTDKNNFKFENNLAENNEAGNLPEGPCQGIGDPSKQYTSSALVAAAVGGVFIGAFAVLLLFHLRQKCKKYVNGDYRRVPMEYDFELNPRFKAH